MKQLPKTTAATPAPAEVPAVAPAGELTTGKRALLGLGVLGALGLLGYGLLRLSIGDDPAATALASTTVPPTGNGALGRFAGARIPLDGFVLYYEETDPTGTSYSAQTVELVAESRHQAGVWFIRTADGATGWLKS